MIKKNITFKILLKIFVLLGFLPCYQLQADNIPDKYFAKGIVSLKGSDNSVESGAFASVVWIERSKVVSTDEDGKFEFKDLSGNKITLVASYVGYKNDTITLVDNGKLLRDNNNIEFSLQLEGNMLESVVVTGRRNASYLSKMTPIKTEVITATGLCKMACCSLAESFENSASVSVGYSDAVTGAKQIKLLGLSGAYTQMLDENRPVMRGLAAPFGLSYIPGQWLESIQIAKGPSSVINGLEAITGQINMEHRKPTSENPLFVNLFLNNNLKTEANVASSLALGKDPHWYTVIMAHASVDAKCHDGNGDNFKDEPYTHRYALDNRWLFAPESGIQLRFGIRGLYEDRIGGMMDYKAGMNERNQLAAADMQWGEGYVNGIWGSEINNRSFDGFVKLGIPLNEDNSKNLAMVGDFNWYKMNSSFGVKNFDGIQRMNFFNMMYMHKINDSHQYTIGVSGRYDDINSTLADRYVLGGLVEDNTIEMSRKERVAGAYGEYTFNWGEKLTLVAGIRADYNYDQGWQVAPRANIKYSFTPTTIVRLNAGRGFRTPDVIADNLGVLSSGRKIVLENGIKAEDAWTFGGNFTQYFKIGENENNYISFDYFRTNFNRRLIVDWDKSYSSVPGTTSAVALYFSDKKSFTDTYQVDFSIEPIERFSIITTFRYTKAKVTMDNQGLVDAPLTSKYKGVLNLQYATSMRKWVFDFTAQINGPVKMPEFMKENDSPAYPMLFAQVTRKFKGLEIYAGVENITNYKQKNPIISPNAPFSQDFNTSMVWGPLMGTMGYIGLRYTLWK